MEEFNGFLLGKTTSKEQRHFKLDLDVFKILQREGAIKEATLHETFGPNWKHLYWINNKPFVRK